MRFLTCLSFVCVLLGQPLTRAADIAWKGCLSQKPEWYSGKEAAAIADQVLLYQRRSGAWPKNTDFAAPLDAKRRREIRRQRTRNDGTIDNGATYRPLEFLARVISATTGKPRYRQAFNSGLDCLFESQYANGGWPQILVGAKGYHRHITFNDGAMVGVLRLLRAVRDRVAPFEFVSKRRRVRARTAVRKGVECILKSQIRLGGRLTVWCAQHDAVHLEPRGARSYEHPSLSGIESVGIAQFLSEIEEPSEAVIVAVESATRWFELAKIAGLRVDRVDSPGTERGFDKKVIADANAKPIWARFYEIPSQRPIFSSRDGVVRYALREISSERRNGYSWYGSDPAGFLQSTAPKWRARHAAAISAVQDQLGVVEKPGVVLLFDDTGATVRNREVREESSGDYPDTYLDEWLSAAEFLEGAGVAATFSFSNLDRYSEAQLKRIRILDRLGHEVGPAALRRENAGAFVRRHSLAKYLKDRVAPAVQLLRDQGISSKTFVYTSRKNPTELDTLLLRRFRRLVVIQSIDSLPEAKDEQLLLPLSSLAAQRVLTVPSISKLDGKRFDRLRLLFAAAVRDRAVVAVAFHNVSRGKAGVSIAPTDLKRVVELARDVGLDFYRAGDLPVKRKSP
ncbi:MAG: pectate lyase [Planctomycetota bacterium]